MIRSRLKRIGKKLLGRADATPAPVSRPAAAKPPAEPASVPAAAASTPAEPAAPAPTQQEPIKQEPAAPTVGSFASLAAMAASGQLGEARHADEGTDIEAYRERMRARGIEGELASEGMNTAEDGAQFVGPVDNESSRACASGRVLSIDQQECISCGTCVEQTEDVFFLGEDDKSGEEVKAEVLQQVGPMDLIQDAIDACPVTCIEWIQRAELSEIHSYGGHED